MTNAYELDFRKDATYDMTYQVGRTLNVNIDATICDGQISLWYYTLPDPIIDQPFPFSAYTGAILVVKTNADFPFSVLEFSTEDGSIVLNDSSFDLIKTDEEMTIRYGHYKYDMYLISGNNKIPFARGQFVLTQNIS